MPFLAACPKKPVPVVDAGMPVQAVEDAGSTLLVPMDDDDAGVDAGTDAGPKKYGPAVPSNILRLKQCCAALKNQAKSLGASPEAGVILGVATQCDAMASQAGPSGNAPELGVLKNLMAGKTIPPVCQGF